jgi:hypothetical protein
LSATLRDHIVNHNSVRDRELDATLRAINVQLASWMQTAGARAAVGVPLMPEQVDIAHLRERFYDPANDIPPAPLEDVSDEAPDRLDLDVIRRQGGPTLGELRRQLVEAIESGDATTASEVFNALPDELRRPVEILGLLHLLAATSDDDAAATLVLTDISVPTELDLDVIMSDPAIDRFHTLRPDGSAQTFLLARRELSLDDAHALAGDEVPAR